MYSDFRRHLLIAMKRGQDLQQEPDIAFAAMFQVSPALPVAA